MEKWIDRQEDVPADVRHVFDLIQETHWGYPPGVLKLAAAIVFDLECIRKGIPL